MFHKLLSAVALVATLTIPAASASAEGADPLEPTEHRASHETPRGSSAELRAKVILDMSALDGKTAGAVASIASSAFATTANCEQVAFGDDLYEVTRFDISGGGVTFCSADGSMSADVATREAWADSDLQLVDFSFDTDGDPHTGCLGFEYVALTTYSIESGLFGVLYSDFGTTCDQALLEPLELLSVSRPSSKSIVSAFSVVDRLSNSEFFWATWLCDSTDTCYEGDTDVAPETGVFSWTWETYDYDDDGVPYDADNCADAANADQADGDRDGVGDECDVFDSRPFNRIFVTNVIQSGPAEYDFYLGRSEQEILTGDWNGNGRDGFAVRTGRTIDQYDEHGIHIRTISYGSASDTNYRVGDWNGDGIDTLAVQRGNIFHITDSPTATGQFRQIGYGRRGDEVFVGDWDGDGVDTFAVRRKNEFFVRNSVTSGPADVVFGYGKVGDEVLIGDWDTDGTDTFAVRRKNVIFIRNDFNTGVAHAVIGYGKATDTLLVGDWNGDNVDTFAVRRIEAAN